VPIAQPIPQTYKDPNGVTWKLVLGAHAMSAFVPDDASPRYSDSPDIGPVSEASDSPDMLWAAWGNLRGAIDTWALDHKGDVVLPVTAHRDSSSWLWWALAAWLVLRG
jgi:hypothetical protein